VRVQQHLKPVMQSELDHSRAEVRGDHAEVRAVDVLIAGPERRMIRRIEGVHAQLYSLLFFDLHRFQNAHIQAKEPRATEEPPLQNSQRTGGGIEEYLAGEGGIAIAVDPCSVGRIDGGLGNDIWAAASHPEIHEAVELRHGEASISSVVI